MVLILHFLFRPLEGEMLRSFLIGSALVILGLTVFLFGIDQGLEPIGHGVGTAITRSNSYAVIITVDLILGFFISYAEPDLHILAGQIDKVTAGRLRDTLLVVSVSIGISVMMTLGLLRILKNIRLRFVFLGIYALIFVLAASSSQDFLAIAFDASGATTGAITVPFILALAGGISSMKKDSTRSESDSFGLIGVSSSGAILGVLITGLFIGREKLAGALPDHVPSLASGANPFTSRLMTIAGEAFLTLLPIMITYLIFQLVYFKHRKNRVIDIVRGLVLTFLGLVIFLLGVNGGFMNVGTHLGKQLAQLHSSLPLLLVALLLGLTTVLAEPAVHVLTSQVEEITGGSVKRRLVLIFLSLSVGLSILMSALRILIPGIRLWMYLLPGFGSAVLLAFFVPDLFVGMAFDAGGVASGPMTATFSLAFVQGIAAQVPTADVIADGFGMIAIVAMMPIIAIELLGLLYQSKSRKAVSDALPDPAEEARASSGGNHDE